MNRRQDAKSAKQEKLNSGKNGEHHFLSLLLGGLGVLAVTVVEDKLNAD